MTRNAAMTAVIACTLCVQCNSRALGQDVIAEPPPASQPAARAFGLRSDSYLMVPGWFPLQNKAQRAALVSFARGAGLRLLPTHEWWLKDAGIYRPRPELRALLAECRIGGVSVGMHTLLAVGYPAAPGGPQWPPLTWRANAPLRDPVLTQCRMLTPAGWRYQAEGAALACLEHGITWVYSDGLEEAVAEDAALDQATRTILTMQREALRDAGVTLTHDLIGSDPTHVPSACDFYATETLTQSLFVARRQGEWHSLMRCIETGKGAAGTAVGVYGCVGWVPFCAPHGIDSPDDMTLVLDYARGEALPVAMQLHAGWLLLTPAERAGYAAQVRKFVDGR